MQRDTYLKMPWIPKNIMQLKQQAQKVALLHP